MRVIKVVERFGNFRSSLHGSFILKWYSSAASTNNNSISSLFNSKNKNSLKIFKKTGEFENSQRVLEIIEKEFDKHPNFPTRTRFAPSPTGFLHLGSLRTALYNYLLAKNTGGQFLLRLEDTDQTRLIPGAEENLYKCLEWLGLENDEGSNNPSGNKAQIGSYKQSERADIYEKYTKDIMQKGQAYKCFCSKDRLETLLESSKKLKPKSSASYDRHCYHLTNEEIKAKEKNGEKYVVRLKAPDVYPVFEDLVLGKINFQPRFNYEDKRFDDPVLMKSDGLPTYHFANVIDDHLMKISHVIRGEEWVPSTPKHKYLYEAMGWSEPKFIHLPLLAGSTNNKKLSKRRNDSNIWEMKKRGYLPEALINYVAGYGWSLPKNENGSSIYDLEDLVKLFNINKLTKGNTKISPSLLEHMNKQHLLKILKSEKGINRVTDMIMEDEETPSYIRVDRTKIKKILSHVGETLDNWKDFVKQFDYCYLETDYNNEGCSKFKSNYEKSEIVSVINYTINKNNILLENKNIIDLIKEGLQLSDKKIIFETLRYSLTGSKKGSALHDILRLLGKEEALNRLRESLKHL
ncbi:hypothetical protein QEN19_000579 [Hanseniaspora menglaensis]